MNKWFSLGRPMLAEAAFQILSVYIILIILTLVLDRFLKNILIVSLERDLNLK